MVGPCSADGGPDAMPMGGTLRAYEGPADRAGGGHMAGRRRADAGPMSGRCRAGGVPVQARCRAYERPMPG